MWDCRIRLYCAIRFRSFRIGIWKLCMVKQVNFSPITSWSPQNINKWISYLWWKQNVSFQTKHISLRTNKTNKNFVEFITAPNQKYKAVLKTETTKKNTSILECSERYLIVVSLGDSEGGKVRIVQARSDLYVDLSHYQWNTR